MEKSLLNSLDQLRPSELCYVLVEPTRVNVDIGKLLRSAVPLVESMVDYLDDDCRKGLITAFESQLPGCSVLKTLYNAPPAMASRT